MAALSGDEPTWTIEPFSWCRSITRQNLRDCGGRILCRGWSGGMLVLVDESVTSGRFHDLELGRICAGGVRGWQRWPLLEGTVRPMGGVVPDVVDDEPFELGLVPGDGAVEEFAAYRSDPLFREGVGNRSTDGCLEDLEAPSAEDLVKCVDELGLPRSRSSAREPASCSAWRKNRLRAAWVAQAPVGLAVTPA
jgi:hypothetical protein